jgi:hypothetical protein
LQESTDRPRIAGAVTCLTRRRYSLMKLEAGMPLSDPWLSKVNLQ